MEARVGVAVDGGGVRKLVQPPPPKHIGTVSQLLAGGVAGAFSKSCTAPLARLTILFQVPIFLISSQFYKKKIYFLFIFLRLSEFDVS